MTSAFFRAEALGAPLPLAKDDLPEGLKNAYAARSEYVHALKRLGEASELRTFGLLSQHIGQANDCIERRAQLMTHIREELRFMLARNLKLAALLLKLAKQARILDREHRLGRESLQKIDGRFREQSRLFAADIERADDAVRSQ